MASRDMTLRDELTGLTPRLRRYARALVNGNPSASTLADDLIHATLMRALGARHLGLASDLIIRLYATVTQLNREMAVAGQHARAAGAGHPHLVATAVNFAPARQTRLAAALLALPLEHREAVLLVGLEGFGYAESARILRVSRNVFMTRLAEGRASLDSALKKSPQASPAGQRVPYLRLVT